MEGAIANEGVVSSEVNICVIIEMTGAVESSCTSSRRVLPDNWNGDIGPIEPLNAGETWVKDVKIIKGKG